MNKEEVIKQFLDQKMLVFSFEDFCAFYPQENPETIKKCLFRLKKRGWLSSLRKGLYEITFPQDSNLPDLYLANKIYAPSYVSLQTALSHYGIIPEVAMAVTSITSKTTRQFKNKYGLFIYRAVQPKMFCGYQIEKYNGYNVLIAEPEKALMDYIYFQTFRGQKFDREAHRIDMKRVKKMNKKKIQNYAQLFGLKLKESLYAHI
ncbi:MAG TPA: hypothetical protein PLH56_00075 [Candidatus Omnitrophota bacterium]|nr:hypothetical protein [Candidatus Omnitrophota bacterium]